MKKLIMICALVTLISLFGSTAKADIPVYWSFNLTTSGARDDWYSTSFIDPGYLQYDYDWQLTGAYLQAVGAWHDILYLIPAYERSGSGNFPGFPFTDELILHIEHPEITADFLSSIDNDGYGTISIANLTFGQIEYEGNYYDVTGARFQGDVTIIPEPATFVLLGTAGLWILTGKKRFV